MPAAPEVVWVNGRVVAAAEATLPLLDRGIQFGEALFETVRVYRGRPFRLAAHVARLAAGATALGMRVPDLAAVAGAVAAFVPARGLPEARLRILWTAGPPGGAPTLALTAEPAVRPDRPAVVVLAPPRLQQPGAGGWKLVGRLEMQTALASAQRGGADDILFVSPEGEVLEGSRSNVFLVRAGRVVTPPADGRLLAGVTRTAVLECAAAIGVPAAEAPIRVVDLATATEVFLTGSVAELWPVAEVRGHFRGAAPGPVTARLHAAYRDLVAREVGA